MRVTILVAAACAACTPAFGQTVIQTHEGQSDLDALGTSVAAIGLVDGDGIPDYAVGAPGDDGNGNDAGRVTVYSGLDGSVLFELEGEAGDQLGESLAGAGDVDADGVDDIIAGAPGDGRAWVFSGIDGSVLYKLPADGFTVGGNVDVNDDGHADLVTGMRNDDTVATNAGRANVYSGDDGSVLYTFYGDSAWDWFGNAVCGVGDVDADGFGDVLIAAFFDDANGNDSGTVYVFSGFDGSVLHTLTGEFWNQGFGEAVGAAGDVDGDGHADFIVGTPDNDDNGANAGRAQVFSGCDGALLFTYRGDSALDHHGTSVQGAGDVDGDGLDDVIVGAPQDDNTAGDTGSARVYSSKDGSVLCTFDGDNGFDWFGGAVAGIGDVDADGRSDLVVGAKEVGHGRGRVRVYSSCLEIGTNYCGPAVPNSTGKPGVIRAMGSGVAADDAFRLRAMDLPPAQFGYFLVSATQGFVAAPPGAEGNLCLGGEIGRFRDQTQSTGVGSFSITVDLTSLPTKPPHAVVAGETWNFQAWFRDANPGQTSNFTDGLSVLFQ